MKLLSSIFAIDLCTYSVMHNHYHIVLRVDTQKATLWTDHDVARRWTTLFSGPRVIHQFMAQTKLSASEEVCVALLIATWRKRLMDLSWFMRCLNEPIARMAYSKDRIWTPPRLQARCLMT